MTLTDAELDEFIAIFEADGCQVTREEAREGVLRMLTLYEQLMRPTVAEMEALRLDDSGTRAKVEGESPPTPPRLQ
jgi:hypothetical protein